MESSQVVSRSAHPVGAAEVDRLEVDRLELEQQVCFALAVASRAVIGVYRPILEPLGLTHPQYLVMLALWQHAPMSVKNISRRLRLEPATLSPLLKRLEASGLVTRRRDPSDERSLQVALTESGRGLRKQALAIPGQVMEQLAMDVVTVRELHAVLMAVIGRVDEGSIDRASPLPE